MSYYLCKNSGIHHALCPNLSEFCPKSAVKAAFEKKDGKKSSDDFEENPLREYPFRLAAARQSTFPKGTASAVAAKFPAKSQSLRACLLPLGGAVAQRLRGYKWRSEKSVKAIAPTGAALAFLCFDFFFRIVKGVQPLARCGVGGVQR